MASRKRIFWMALLVATLLCPFFFLSSPMEPWVGPNKSITSAQEFIYPVELAFHTSTQTLTTLWRHYFDLADAAKENEQLKAELALQKTRLLDYDEQVQEVSRLRSLLGFAKRMDRKITVAEVASSPTRMPFQSIRITRGSSDGIRIGMPVVTDAGVVGRVIRTGINYADVQLLVDSGFYLDVLLQRTRVRGVLRGIAGDRALLQLHRRAEIRIGDTVITSGLVGGFPKGLPVGRVMRISYESDNVSQIITIEPWVDYRRLEEVMVLNYEPSDLQKISEAAGPAWLEKTVDAGSGG